MFLIVFALSSCKKEIKKEEQELTGKANAFKKSSFAMCLVGMVLLLFSYPAIPPVRDCDILAVTFL